MEQRRCVIIGGAPIGNYPFVRGHLRAGDFCVFCDGGLRHRKGLGVAPDLVVGDFDSFENPHLSVETVVLPCEKDDTDTVYAAREALRRGFRSFLLLGAAGGRLDHTIANLSLLLMIEEAGGRAELVDDYSVMRLVGATPTAVAGDCAFFSLLNITGEAAGICIRGAKYPLTNGEIPASYQYGVSNEVLPGESAVVSVARGRLLLMEVYRDADAGCP